MTFIRINIMLEGYMFVWLLIVEIAFGKLEGIKRLDQNPMIGISSIKLPNIGNVDLVWSSPKTKIKW